VSTDTSQKISKFVKNLPTSDHNLQPNCNRSTATKTHMSKTNKLTRKNYHSAPSTVTLNASIKHPRPGTKRMVGMASADRVKAWRVHQSSCHGHRLAGHPAIAMRGKPLRGRETDSSHGCHLGRRCWNGIGESGQQCLVSASRFLLPASSRFSSDGCGWVFDKWDGAIANSLA
jgi:hypothetical protein